MYDKHIAILMGGISSERSVSLSSGSFCAECLEKEGFHVTRIDVDRNIGSILKNINPSIAFNALHGKYGEDGIIQGILEYLNIPYTHSGVLSSALGMNKNYAKIIASSANIPVPPSIIINISNVNFTIPFNYPYVIKPIKEGSSIGIKVIFDKGNEELLSIISNWKFEKELLCEQYIYGREFTCAVIGNTSLEVCEIIPNQEYKFYDQKAKYTFGASQYICPAKISENLRNKIKEMSLTAHQAFGCRSISRSDFRYNEKENTLFWLEINTQPGMTQTSLFPKIAAVSGYNFFDLISWIMKDASCMR